MTAQLGLSSNMQPTAAAVVERSRGSVPLRPTNGADVVPTFNSVRAGPSYESAARGLRAVCLRSLNFRPSGTRKADLGRSGRVLGDLNQAQPV
jgi:hypothetical protein